METTGTLLLDRWKKHRGLVSDYAAAKELKVTVAAVSKWRNGKGHPDAARTALMADEIGADTLGILAAIEADRSRSEAERAVWRRYGKPAFIGLLATTATALFSPSDAVGKVEKDHFATGVETAEKASYAPIMRTDPASLAEWLINALRRVWVRSREAVCRWDWSTGWDRSALLDRSA